MTQKTLYTGSKNRTETLYHEAIFREVYLKVCSFFSKIELLFPKDTSLKSHISYKHIDRYGCMYL